MRNPVKPAFVRSPVGLFVILAASIFVAELIAMQVLDRLPPLPPLLAHFFDATLLVVLVFPALRVFAFTPLLRHLRAREAAEEELREANRTLEQRVRDRTTALEESAQSIRLLLDSIAEGFYGVDLQGNCTRINRSALRMLGYDTEEELLGRHIHELIHHTRPDGTPYPADECRMYQALRDRTECHVDDEVFWRPDGTSFPVEYRSHPIFRDGQLIGAVASFFDITERKRATEALRESEERFRSVAQSATDAIIVANSKGNIISWNNAAQTIFGYATEEVVDKSLAALMPERYREAHQTGLRRFLATGKARVIGRTVELHGRRKDGSEFPLELSLSAWSTAKGQFFTGILRDITERKRAAAELQWKTAFLEAQVNSSLDGILVVDQEGKKILQNQRTTDLLKIPQPIVDDKDDAQQVRWVTNMTKNPESFVAKVVYLYSHPNEISHDEIELKDGTVLDRYSAPVVGADGENYGRIWTFRDITERQRLQQARERMITELQQALADVKQLGGLLPICAGCKKIRDDTGYWNQVEAYITERSAAKFTHGLCPICTRKFFPDLTPEELDPNP